MKLCPICATSYPAGHRTCPTHGTVLVETPDLAPGTVIRDCYRIERVLGRGGMGTVYLAEHTLMNEPRALKFLSGALASNPVFVQRFVQEAKAATKLRHVNIAQTHELGQSEDGSFYICMEFVDGPSLRALLEQSPDGLPLQRAFNIVHGVAEGLGAAHAKHMVHRDVKPENILLGWSGDTETAKVVDFGIVAMSDSVGRLTQTGRPLLTAEYAAPEQWRGVIPPSDLDGRTDLYALGCVFYEMLTGRLPFHADTYEGWFEQHVHGTIVPPSMHRIDLARYPGLDALTLKLLAKERDQRPANMAEFLADLDRIIAAGPQSAGSFDDAAKRKQTVLEGPFQSGPAVLGPAVSGPAAVGAAATGQPSAQADAQPRNSGPAVWTPLPNVNPQQMNPQQMPGFSSGQVPGQGLPGQVPGQAASQTGGASPSNPPQAPASTASGAGANRAFSAGGRTAFKVVGGLAFAAFVVLLVVGILNQRRKTHDEQSTNQASTESSPQPDTATPTPGPSAVIPPGPKPQPTVRVPNEPRPVTPQPTPAANDPAATAKKAVALYNAHQYVEARPLFADACDRGHADSCDYLGWLYQHSLGVSQDYAKALSLYHQGCQGGSMAGCSNEGVMYQDHFGVAQDYARAVALYTKSCDGDFATGCDNLGYMYQFKLGVAQDYPRAISLYEKACSNDNMNGCKNLGWMYQNKLGVEQDFGRAATLYEKACNGGNLEGCNNLGYLYQHKQGVEQDYSKALALYKKACDGGQASACNNLGVMYEDKQGVPQDYQRAAALYQKACDGGNANGCSDLGDLYRTGSGVPKDSAKARALLTKGCSMGNKWGCDRLKDVQ